MSSSNNQSEGLPLSNSNENSSLPIVSSRTQTFENSTPGNMHHMSSEQIILEVRRLIQAVSTPYWERARRQNDWVKFHHELEADYQDFKVAYPALFRMVIENGRNFDMEQLIQFLSLREAMIAGNVAERDAHQHVGQAMVDKYVIPNLPPDSRN